MISLQVRCAAASPDLYDSTSLQGGFSVVSLWLFQKTRFVKESERKVAKGEACWLRVEFCRC